MRKPTKEISTWCLWPEAIAKRPQAPVAVHCLILSLMAVGCGATEDGSADTGVGADSGTTRDSGRGCARILAPVCGCDWVEYPNLCVAMRAGASLSSTSPCPVAPADHCALTPTAASGSCGSCFDDADCPGTLAPICVGAACATGSEGQCAFSPPLGSCYDRRQCDTDEVCVGSDLTACPPAQGSCEPAPA